jgi:hypothetical protein
VANATASAIARTLGSGRTRALSADLVSGWTRALSADLVSGWTRALSADLVSGWTRALSADRRVGLDPRPSAADDRAPPSFAKKRKWPPKWRRGGR